MKKDGFEKVVLCELGDPGVEGWESWSPFCLKVHRALKLAGIEYERRHGAPRDFRSLNPTGQVPVLIVDGEPIADSTAILERIDRMVPGAFAHGEPAVDAEIALVEELADTSINAYLVAARWADERNWPAVQRAYFAGMPGLLRRVLVPKLRKEVLRRLVAREVWRRGADHCWSEFTRLLDRLEARAPRQAFWCTERISTADLALFGQLHSLRSPLNPWQRDRVFERTALWSYLERVHSATRAQNFALASRAIRASAERAA